MGVTPQDGLNSVREGLRQAIADIWSGGRVPDADGWTPHVSIAYSRVTGPADVYEKAMADEHGSVDITISKVQLIVLGRDEHEYQWTMHSEVLLSDA